MAFKETLEFVIKGSVADFSASIKKAKGDLKSLKDAVEASKSGLFSGKFDTAGQQKARAEAEKLLGTINKLIASEKQLTAQQKNRLQGQVLKYKSTLSAAAPSAEAAIESRAAQAAIKQSRELSSKAITLRYALYDVGSAAQNASRAMLGYASAVLQAQMAQETAFSQIEKTLVGEVGAKELDSLRKELVELSTQIPVSFTELSKIGMLGSQLGVLAPDIANFTEVVAKFTAITGMSVEETSLGFGKIANLLGLSSDQYQALGSAIAYVGVKSAATEQQIMSTAGQIAAVAKSAGLTASEVIGLSAAMASLKIAPEEARSVLVQTFNAMSQATLSFNEGLDKGNERLESFAEIAGISSAEFAKGWSDKSPEGASKIWQKFVTGLGKTDVSRALQRIGLDGVRTSKGLTALASNVDMIFGPSGTLAQARSAGTKGTFLDESFGTIVNDLSSKIKMMENSFQNLFAAMLGGSQSLDVIKGIIDTVTNLNKALTNLVNKSDFAKSISGVVFAIAAIGGGLLALVATIAIAGGGFLALQTAFRAAAVEGIFTQRSILGVIASLLGVSVPAKAASTGLTSVGVGAGFAGTGITKMAMALRILKYALISTGVGLLVVLIGEFISVMAQAGDAADEPVTGLDETQKAAKEAASALSTTTQELVEFINMALESTGSAINLENALYGLGQSLQNGAKDFSLYSAAGRANMTALQSVISAYAQQAQGDQQTLANNLQALMNYMIGAGLGTKAAFEEIQKAIDATGKTAASVLPNFASMDAGLKNISTSAGKAKTAVEKLSEAFDKAFKTMGAQFDSQQALDNLGEAIGKNGKAISIFSKGGRDNFNALKDTIFALKDQFAGNPQALSNRLLALRMSMIKMGVTSKVAFKMIDTAMAVTGKKGKTTAKEIAAIFNQISQAMQLEIADTQEIRTITDYVSDLGSVLQDALTNRYAKQEAEDSISSAWNSIKESAEDAKKAIDDANQSISEMRADKTMLEYQLQVAVRYGDTVRADAIRGKLSKVDKDIAAEQEKITKAQEATNKSLVGNSQAAIDNRSKVRGLVGQYNDYLLSLARTGMSSDDLKKEAAKLADEFLTQGKNMGFAETELLSYTDAFKTDFTTVINNLPNDVNVNVVTDPALQAVVDFVKSTNSELAKILTKTIDIVIPPVTIPPIDIPPIYVPVIAGNGGPSGGKPSGGADTGTTTPAPSWVAVAKERMAYIQGKLLPAKEAALAKNYVYANGLLATPAGIANQNRLKADIAALNSELARIKSQSFATGGSVSGPGGSTSDSIPAMLSNGEYVLRANAVKYYGTDFMNSLNQMQIQRPASAGVGSGGVVYLSPDDRALLRAAIDRPISLYTDNATIAKSANAGNIVLAQRGSK